MCLVVLIGIQTNWYPKHPINESTVKGQSKR
jgi:hypothetical protein